MIDPGLRETILYLAEQTGMTPHQICNLTFAEIQALRDQAQHRADVATAKLAWLEAAEAVMDDPEGDRR